MKICKNDQKLSEPKWLKKFDEEKKLNRSGNRI